MRVSPVPHSIYFECLLFDMGELGRVISNPSDSPREPPTGKSFLLVGSSDGEEIWEVISQEQALTVARRISQEFSKDARAELQSR
jgi:hypothetical protein